MQEPERTLWERLQVCMKSGLGDDGWAAAVGLHLGMAVALRHPEWAAAMCKAIDEDGMVPTPEPTSVIADRVVEDLPIEVCDGA